MNKLLVSVVFAALTIVACTSKAPPSAASSSPSPLGDPCETACAALRSANCTAGKNKHCEEVCAHDLDAGLTPINTACLSTAISPDEVRKCGTVCKVDGAAQ